MTPPPRWIDMGDSIESLVLSDTGTADQRRLASYQLQAITGIPICNLSSPGQRVTEGGQAGFGAWANRNAIKTVAGYANVSGITFMLGTNDQANYSTDIYTYIQNYKDLIRYARVTVGMPVVVITPFWRDDHAEPMPHIDGGMWTLDQWRYYTAMLAYEVAAEPGHFVSVFHGNECPLLPCHFVADGTHPNEAGNDIIRDWRLAKMQSVGYWL